MNLNFEILLKKLISFRSVSTDPKYRAELTKTKNYLKDLLISSKFEIIETNFDSILLAKYIANPNAKNILLYGHYDVQPAEDAWETEPFSLAKHNNRYWGRGVADNKGPLLANIFAATDLIDKNLLNCNIYFLIEGQEEIGSHDLKEFLTTQNNLLGKIDYIIVTDALKTDENPIITTHFRGNIAFELKLLTLSNDLHSGIYGGAVSSALDELNKLNKTIFSKAFIEKLNKKVTINHLDTVKDSLLKFDKHYFSQHLADLSSKDASVFSSINSTLKNSLIVTGLQSGYIGEGIKNIIPSTALAKYNLRTVFGVNSSDLQKEIEQLIKNYCTKNNFSFNLKFDRTSEPVQLSVDNELVQKAIKTFEEIYKRKVLLKPEGGSISVISLFKELLTDKILLTGFATYSSNMHGANENIKIQDLELGVEFLSRLLKNLSN